MTAAVIARGTTLRLLIAYDTPSTGILSLLSRRLTRNPEVCDAQPAQIGDQLPGIDLESRRNQTGRIEGARGDSPRRQDGGADRDDVAVTGMEEPRGMASAVRVLEVDPEPAGRRTQTFCEP